MRQTPPLRWGHQISIGALLGAAVLLAVPGLAWAQDDAGDASAEGDSELDAIEDAFMESVDAEPVAPADEPAELPEIGEDVLEDFILDRGFYVASDLGIFLTLGGTRGYSNVQPILSLRPGFDIGDLFSIQLDISLAYASGNPVSNADRKAAVEGSTANQDATVDFGIINVGAEGVFAIRPLRRLAIEITAGGGYTFIDPPLTDPNSTVGVNTKVDGSGGHYVVGVDFKYLTLLTNFTAGASVKHYGFIGGWGYIPAIAITATVRYTFFAM